jgi:hypothetical protein
MKYRVAVALILTPIGVKAQTSEAPAKAVESPTKEKKICRSMTPTGSFMATRVCNSAAAWRKFDGITAEGGQQTRDVYRMTTTGVPH